MKHKLSFSDKKFLIKCWNLRQQINNDKRFFNALTIAATHPAELNQLSAGIMTLIMDTLSTINKDNHNA